MNLQKNDFIKYLEINVFMKVWFFQKFSMGSTEFDFRGIAHIDIGPPDAPDSILTTPKGFVM